MRQLDRTLSFVAETPGVSPGRRRWHRLLGGACRAALVGAIALFHSSQLLAREPARASTPQLAALSKAGSAARAGGARARGPAAVELAAGACRLGRWAAAVDLMRVVSRQERSADDWLCLARAQRHTGEWVAALDSYDELAESSGTSPRARSARQLGAAEREELEAQLAWIQIVPSAPLPSEAQLTLDGDALAPSLLRVAFPVSPGTHELALEVEGGVQKWVRLRFEEGERRRVHFALPSEGEALELGSQPPGGTTSTKAVWSRRALVAGGVATGGGLGLMWLSGRAGDARKTVFYSGAGGMFLGGLSLLTGALLRIGADAEPASDRSTARRPRLQLEPWLGANVAGVSGKF